MKKNNLLHALNKIAIRFQIDPSNSVGQAAKLSSITNVLSKIEQTYQKFIEIELLKNEAFSRVAKGNPMLVQIFHKDLELIAVDVDFKGFAVALAPNILQKNQLIFSDTSMELKRTAFDNFKNLVTGDFRSIKYIKQIEARYTPQERAKIYRPLFNALSPDYKLNIQDANKKTIRTIVKPENKKLLEFYLPTPPKVSTSSKHKTVLAYVDLNQMGDEIKFSSRHINKIYHIEELQYDTYPYTPQVIEVDDFKVEFHEKIYCEVHYQNDKYLITNSLLDISVGGNSREAAIDLFNTVVVDLYKNYDSAVLENLSEEEKSIKERLFRITKAINIPQL